MLRFLAAFDVSHRELARADKAQRLLQGHFHLVAEAVGADLPIVRVGSPRNGMIQM